MNSSVTVEQLKRAVEIKEQIEQLNTELASILAGQEVGSGRAATAGVGKRGGMSAAGRAKIAAAQKARWAKTRGGATEKKSTTPKVGKRKGMSPAARAKIAAAAKARWAKAKAAGKKAL